MLKSLHINIQGNPDLDFLDQNPEFRYLTPFKNMLLSYGPEESSRIFWAVYLMEHPNSSLYRIPREDRKQEIEDNYLEGEFPWEEDEIKDFSGEFMKLSLSKTQLLYKIWADKLDELSSYLAGLSFDKKTEAAEAFRIMEKMDKIWKAYFQAEQLVSDEDQKGELRGGGARSFRETRQA